MKHSLGMKSASRRTCGDAAMKLQGAKRGIKLDATLLKLCATIHGNARLGLVLGGWQCVFVRVDVG